METVVDFIFLAPKSLQIVTAATKLKDTYSFASPLHSMSRKESCDQTIQHVKKQRHCFVNKGPSSQGYGFSSSHVCESWTVKKTSTEELVILNCGVGEDFCESLGLQGDPTSPS